MRLTGPQIQKLQKAILLGFDAAQLKQLTLFQLDTDLDEIVSPGPLAKVVFQLIVWANQGGQVESLINAVRGERSQIQELQLQIGDLLREVAEGGGEIIEPEKPDDRVGDRNGGRATPPIYISYAWGNDGEDVVDRVYDSLKADGYDIRRDKHDLAYKGSITEFEKEIGRGACVVVVVSDKSLRSPHCMYELLEIFKNLNFRERIMPIVLQDAKIQKLKDRLGYVQHWQAEYRELEKLIIDVGPGALAADGSFGEYQKIKEIFQHADKLVSILGDMNTATPNHIAADDFELLKSAIEEQIRRWR